MAIGREALQGLCNEWLKTSIAKQSRVAELTIRPKGSKLTISNLRIEAHPDAQPGDHLHFPRDYLLNFLIERVVPLTEQQRLKDLVDTKRYRGGLPTCQRFVVGPKRPLVMRCKNPECGLVIPMNLVGYHGQPPPRTLSRSNARDAAVCFSMNERTSSSVHGHDLHADPVWIRPPACPSVTTILARSNARSSGRRSGSRSTRVVSERSLRS
jgi:hypothetical protein